MSHTGHVSVRDKIDPKKTKRQGDKSDDRETHRTTERTTEHSKKRETGQQDKQNTKRAKTGKPKKLSKSILKARNRKDGFTDN